jgi:ABC-type sugar transport system substrate-binding protein
MILFSRALLLLLCLSAFCASAQATSVVFLNPGHSNERFWVTYSDYMQDAAADLGLELEVLYGERNTETILGNAHALLERPHRPDYVLFVNEQYLGPEILRLLEDSGIRLFAVHSTLTEEQQQRAGSSRGKYPNWIGSLVPNDEEAGYLMATELMRQAPKGSQLVAFSGVKNTPSAMQREAGLHRALAEHPQVRLRQVLNGEWNQQRAYEQASALLPRYPQVTLVWAANDEMAFGAMQAAQEQGRQLRYTALNNSQIALQARMDGRFAALATGHFILGGCALVMLHDHAAGLDFAERGGKDQMARLLRLVDAPQARKLQARLKRSDIGLDFKRFSATLNPAMQAYSCSIDELLR